MVDIPIQKGVQYMSDNAPLLEEYLGDGVYASFDGYHINLDLRAQDPSRFTIALEPAVFDALVKFSDRVSPRRRLDHARD